jgi:hypothetical protein
MGLSDQLPVARDQIVHGNGRIGRGQNAARPDAGSDWRRSEKGPAIVAGSDRARRPGTG